MKSRFLILVLLVLALFGCKDPLEVPEPECSFGNSYIETSSRSAVMSFDIDVPEGVEVFQVGVVYSTKDKPSDDPDAMSKVVRLSSSKEYSFDLTGLSPLTQYWIQPFAVHYDESVTYGDVETFTTLASKSLNGHEFVNLGLPSGTKWASFNACADGKSGHLIWSDASAFVKSEWGESWRLPTKADWEELMDPANCFWSWDIQNGVQGMLVKGPNVNTIFIPADGYYAKGYVLQQNEYGAYWTADAVESTPGSSWCLFFGVDFVYWNPFAQVCGGSVRPVNNATVYDYD